MAVPAMLVLLVALPEVRQARECREVFGDVHTTRENQSERESRLNFVIDSGTDVVVDHSYSWTAPNEAEFRSLELIETSTDASTAYVSLLASQEDIECDDGVYLVSVDDSLGPGGRVLAVLQRSMLIEMDGRLCYLVPEGETAPRFRVTWSSPFGVRPSRPPARPAKPGRRRN
jgi:hypothetical protein